MERVTQTELKRKKIIIILKPSVNSKRELDERVIPIYSVGVSLLRNR